MNWKRGLLSAYSKISLVYKKQEKIEQSIALLQSSVTELTNKVDHDLTMIRGDQYHWIKNSIEEIMSKQASTLVAGEAPKAVGALKDIQDLSFGMLKEFARICEKYNLSYWLDFGTLLGAVRHGDFIPWDDDMDVAMPSQDFEKLAKIIERELVDTDYVFIRVPSQIGKIVHRDFAPKTKSEITRFIHWEITDKLCFALDIFPYYYVRSGMIIDSLNRSLKAGCSEMDELFTGRHVYDTFSKASRVVKRINNQNAADKSTDKLFLGMETSVYQPRVVDKNDVFPLVKQHFRNTEFFAPNKAAEYLIDIYGDWAQFPKRPHTHLSLNSLPKSELRRLREVNHG